MRMIDRIKQAMRDTGVCDGMSDEDLDIAVTAGLEAMREPTTGMLNEGEDTPIGPHYAGRHGANAVWKNMLNAALNE